MTHAHDGAALDQGRATRRSWWSRQSLQTRLLAAVLLLLLLALLTCGLAAGSLLRSYLEDRVDEELSATVEVLRAPPVQRRLGGAPRPVLPSRFVVSLLDAEGNTVRQSRGLLGEEPPALEFMDASEAAARSGAPFTLEAGDGEPWRVLVTPLGGDNTLTVATSLQDVELTTQRLRRVVAMVGVAVLLLGALAGLVLVRGALRPLRRIETTAAAIAAGDLSSRVPDVAGPSTEVGRLSRTLNTMLGQIENAFAAVAASEQRMRRFVADASHELRTPLTSIRGFAELHRQGAVTEPDEVSRLMGRIEDEATRMAALVEDLLLLARLDQQRPLRSDPVDLVVVASDVVEDTRLTSPDHRLTLQAPEPGVEVWGDEARLRQVVINLVANAVRHTPPGTHVTVRVTRESEGSAGDAAGTGVLEVHDDGPGIPPDVLDTMFEGFARADRARTRGSGGSGDIGGSGRTGGGAGLGLTIVAALVRAHGGEVNATSNPGQGTTLRVVLPLVPRDA